MRTQANEQRLSQSLDPRYFITSSCERPVYVLTAIAPGRLLKARSEWGQDFYLFQQPRTELEMGALSGPAESPLVAEAAIRDQARHWLPGRSREVPRHVGFCNIAITGSFLEDEQGRSAPWL
jgi:hypothetical protein